MTQKKQGASALMQQEWFRDLYKAATNKPNPTAAPTPKDDDDDGFRCIADNLFDTLPDMLRAPAMRFTDSEERELFLIGALGVISGMLPNYYGNYFGSNVGTNLYCFIIGRYGRGKGSLKWARMLGEITHNNRLNRAKEEAAQYSRDKAFYNKQIATYNADIEGTPPTEPQAPRHLKLFIPANTTKTALVQLMEENEGRGIIFETEGDTLADMLRQDYGNFSDILRKAFHHEPVSFFRRANSEDVTVHHPALSVVLSGTHDQVLKLIPTIDNGLYSRFMFYILQGNDEFRNPFASNDATHAMHMENVAVKYAALYDTLTALPRPKQFALNKTQQERFVQHFKYVKEWTQERLGNDLDGSINRMALMAYRIAMILTILRCYGQDETLQQPALYCTDADLDNAIDIMDVLGYNATDVYKFLEKNGGKRATHLNSNEPTDDQKLLCYRYHQQGMSLRKIAAEVFGNKNAQNKVKRILANYGVNK